MNNVKKKEWGIAFVVVVVSIGLYFVVRGLNSSAEPTYLKRIHDKLANGQTIRWGDGKLSAEVVYFDDEEGLILDSKGEQRGVVYEKSGEETSTMFARRMRVRIIEQKTFKMEFEDVVIKTEGSANTTYAEKINMTRQLP